MPTSEQLELVLDAVSFIEANLIEKIDLADIADEVGLSLFYFSRLFSSYSGHSPYDYLMRRRLSEAYRCLLDTDEKIIDIAFHFQFNSPENFSRAFRKMFGLLPAQVRKTRESLVVVRSPLRREDLLYASKILTKDYSIQDIESFWIEGKAHIADNFETLFANAKVRHGYSEPLWAFRSLCNEDEKIIMLGRYCATPSGESQTLFAKRVEGATFLRLAHKGGFESFSSASRCIYETLLPRLHKKRALPIELLAVDGSSLSLLVPVANLS